MRWSPTLALLGAIAACAPLPPAATAETFTAPVTAADGTVTAMQANLCRPVTSNPARLVVIAHGSPAQGSDRPFMRLISCGSEAVRWFTDRGYVVMVFLRRGYGATGGIWAENNGACSQADYVHAGLETARDIDAAVNAATQRPGVRPDGAIVVGQSAGGWGADAYDSVPHPKVAAFVSMAGGRGGHVHNLPNNNCGPDALAAAAGVYGAHASTPMLWVYAANDSFFAPPLAAAMHARFTEAGGRADLHQVGPYGRDGHQLFFGEGGATVWGPLLTAYFDQMAVQP
jgi:dienelactone hydrolase